MGVPSDYRVQAALVAAEIGDRRVLARSGVALTTTLAGIAVIFVLEGAEGSSDPVRFAVSVTATAALAGVAALLWHEARQLSYLRSFYRLFIEPYIPARDLTELRNHGSTGRPGTALRELPALALALLASAVALAIVWADEGPPGTARDVSVYCTVLVAAVAAIIVLIGEFARWDMRLEQLAEGVAKMRADALGVVFVEGQAVLKRDGRQFCVRAPANIPRAELIAGAYFSPADAKQEADRGDGWTRFIAADGAAATGDAGASAALLPSLPARFGPSIAVVVGCAGVLFLVLSVLAGPPEKLPAWAFDSPAIYVSARAAVVTLALFIVANLLVNLASGRVLSSVSQSGLAFSGPSTDELVNVDKKTSAAVDDLRDRQDALQSDTTAITVAFEGLLQKVGELESEIAGKKDGDNGNGQ